MFTLRRLAAAVLGVAALLIAGPLQAEPMTYHTVSVDGVKVFYREAGPKDAWCCCSTASPPPRACSRG
jgi:hypothetical protein